MSMKDCLTEDGIGKTKRMKEAACTFIFIIVCACPKARPLC